HSLPRARIAVLEGKPLGVGAVAQDHRIAAFLDRSEDVGLEHETVVHGDRHVPIDPHAVADFAFQREHSFLPRNRSVVVPVGGDHIHRPFIVFEDRARPPCCGVWVPLFAGTGLDGNRPLESYSALMPAALMIFAHFSRSCAMRSRSTSGGPPAAIKPCLPSSATILGECRNSLNVAL